MNENWDIIEGVITDTVGTISDDIIQEVLDRVLEGAHVEWKGVINTYNDLPVDPEIGDTYFVKDSGITYRWSGDSWVEIQEINPSIYEQLEQEINDIEALLNNKADKSELVNLENLLNNKADTSYVNEKLSKVINLTDDVVNFYVDPVNGSDSNIGTEFSPFKTIQKAVDSIPKLINKDHYIRLSDGIYDEEVSIQGISGAGVLIVRKDGQVSADNPTGIKVRSITYFDMTGYCRVENVEPIDGNIQAQGFIRFSRCSYGTVNRCRSTITLSKPTFVWDGSGGGVNSSYFDNQDICVYSMNGSRIRVDSTNIHGNNKSNVALKAQAAEIYKNGANAWVNSATISEQVSQGGSINRDITAINLTPLNGWQNYNTTTYRARAIKDSAGVVHLQGIIRGGVAQQGTPAIQLPEGYRPKYNNHLFGLYTNDDTFSRILIDEHGVLAVERNSGQHISLSSISFYAGW